MAFAANLKRDPEKRPDPFTFEDFMPGGRPLSEGMDEARMNWKLGMIGLRGKNAKVVNW